MKINENLKTALNTVVEKPAASENKPSSIIGPSSNSVKPPAADVTTLSSQLQALQATIANSPVFDSKKVDMIRSEIESGQFSVDSGKVADGMINDAVAFLKK
jgi:negative regulator of flagellin synthesis FlgM